MSCLTQYNNPHVNCSLQSVSLSVTLVLLRIKWSLFIERFQENFLLFFKKLTFCSLPNCNSAGFSHTPISFLICNTGRAEEWGIELPVKCQSYLCASGPLAGPVLLWWAVERRGDWEARPPPSSRRERADPALLRVCSACLGGELARVCRGDPTGAAGCFWALESGTRWVPSRETQWSVSPYSIRFHDAWFQNSVVNPDW